MLPEDVFSKNHPKSYQKINDRISFYTEIVGINSSEYDFTPKF